MHAGRSDIVCWRGSLLLHHRDDDGSWQMWTLESTSGKINKTRNIILLVGKTENDVRGRGRNTLSGVHKQKTIKCNLVNQTGKGKK